MSAPFAGESPDAYRARRKAEMAGAPTPEAGFEAQKAKVAAQHARNVRKPAPNAINIDTAAEDEEAVSATHKKLAGGVKALDMDAIKAADKDKSWAKKKPEEQQAAAKGTAHSTSTPGSAPKTAGAAAMSKAGVDENWLHQPGEAQKTASVEHIDRMNPITDTHAKKLDKMMAERNNMGAPRTQDNGSSVISGRTIEAKGDELQQARDAATKGSRGGGKAAERAAANRASSPRSAASAAPGAMPVRGPQFSKVGDHGAEVSSAPGRDWITPSQISPAKPAAPVSNPAPHSPAPSANATPAAPSAPTAQPAAPGKMEVIGKGIPSKASGAVAGSRVSSAPDRDWLSPTTASAAKKRMAKAAPKEAVSEEPALAPSAAPKAAKSPAASPAPAPSAPARPAMPGTGGVAQSVGRSVGNVNKTPYGEHNDFSGARGAVGRTPAMPQRTPMASPQMDRANSPAPMPAASRPTPSRPAPNARGGGDIVTPSGPTGGGRTGSAPRGEVGGGRMSHFGGGDNSINVGGDNSGSITNNHNTYVNHYGSGNVSVSDGSGNGRGGYSQSRPSGGGGGGGQPEQEHGGGGTKFNAWYKDSSGHHDLRKGLDHVTGKTGGSGEKLPAPSSAGGKQKPLKGSARASGGGGAQSPTQNQTGTGSTNNWQGPQTVHTASASGNGTAQPIATP